MKTGYSIKTWRFRLHCPNPEWIQRTEEYYQDVVSFYFELLKKRSEIWDLPAQKMQRELECLTVAGRDGRQPQYPLPWGKVPVYFRRSAINKALGVFKISQNEKKTERIDASVTFYKGMYKEFDASAITLKLWDGEKWKWLCCQLKGKEFPEDGEILSPSVVCKDKFIMLHVPVKQENADARTAKERMQESGNIGSIQFTNTDVFALCCVMNADAEQLAVHFIRGGDAYRHHCSRLLKKIEISDKACGRDKAEVKDRGNPSEKVNKKYYMHLKNLSDYHAHLVSRQIVNFCVENQVKIIVLPEYDMEFSKIVQYKSGNFSPLHLSNKIREMLKYKAWAEGIIVLETNAAGTAGVCAKCGAAVVKKGKKDGEYSCINGHTGNRYLNTARNLGRKCLESFHYSVK